jgi:hypothetical protein
MSWAWRPQAGPQKALVECPLKEIFFGGTRGGGKTDGVLGKWALKEEQYGSARERLLMGDLQPLASPDALDPLVVDYPARLAQQFGDLAIAVAAVLPGKRDNVGRQTLLVVTTVRDLALRRAMLPERRTGTTLGDMQLRSHLLNAGTATRGA